MIDITTLHAGDSILLSDIVYTMRDAAHLRIKNLMDEGSKLPVDLKDAFIYYAGPTPAKENHPVGSIGPTTSSRMDKFISCMPKLGIKGMIGKGPRSDEVREYCRKYKMVYLLAIGGCGATYSKHVTSCEEVTFTDLGCESIKRLEVKDFPLIVAFDIYGNSIFERN